MTAVISSTKALTLIIITAPVKRIISLKLSTI